MSGSFNTKNGVIYTGEIVVDGAELETDPIFAQNMFYVNASLEVDLGQTGGGATTLIGDIYLQASNQEGNETPGIGTTSVNKWVTVDTASINSTSTSPVMHTLSNTNFAYRWFRFKYSASVGATGGLEGKIRYTMKGW